jgi:type IX secretion system PorP/SprF family membrane protein
MIQMKNKLFIITALFLSICAFAQQRPHYTQYVLNNYILNPALSGIENYTDLKISGRDQWVGLNGAPQTAYISIHTPIGKKDYKITPTSFLVPGKNPRGNGYWENYNASESHHGIGLTVINDKTGNFNRSSAAVTYAYHLGLSPKANLSAGFSAGLSQFGRNAFKSDFDGNGDPADPAQGVNGRNNKIIPDLGVGLWYYTASTFAGISVQQVIPQEISFAENNVMTPGKLLPHIFATAGYRFLLNEDINALPSVMVKYIAGQTRFTQVDINIKAQYHDLLWIGGSYRLNDGYAAMIGLNIGNTFNLGYAHDFTTTKLNTASRGTHEIVIGFLINNKYGDTCPRNIW